MPDTDTTDTSTEAGDQSSGADNTETQQADESSESNSARENGSSDGLGEAGKQALDRMKSERNEARRKAKAVEKELEELRTQSMSEAEKAVAEAEKRGRQNAMTEYGKRLAKAEFDAAAGRRNPDMDTSTVLEFVDLTRFIDDDGEPDTKAIAAAVERLVPEPAGGMPKYDGGSRTPAPAPKGMNHIIRQATGRA